MLDLRIVADAHPVLGAIETSVNEGDRICLLGPSGIGKTTLLNLIAGLDASQAAMDQRILKPLRIGYLFQEHRLLPWRTLRQNLMLVGVRAPDVTEILSRVGLEGCADLLPDQLSLGMARRAALARCLAVDPDLLLLDEPFASLDPDRAEELQSLIAALLDARPAMAMICVTHEMRDAHRLANRVWYLDGRPARLQYDAPLNRDDGDAARLVAGLRRLGRSCRLG
ncbi:ABC transporter ATP-binding protein [Halomonas campisalis]|uniref:ABC transporter ATP-binding protein n=1 Tax=Billgrantia campisalis TaxID=74661 RepID=A0ABS9P8T5_9GAMM|nr:ATP-binding cassette domain-containing protein [Halomonas campisalis]MCG6658190.1 ABC transporter ATP-binding protein [Halomonas campisalis]MDR5862858.1 ATP-binding cassette domain-containing protein [Halomonas campisalis]